MPEGYPISYGRRWMTSMPTKIAVLPLGYADGIDRRFTNTGEVLIHRRRFPMVGMVTYKGVADAFGLEYVPIERLLEP